MSDLPSRPILGLNQQTYERLKASLNLNLRRQIFIAVCDDLSLRDRLAVQLQTELGCFALNLLGRMPSTAEPLQIPRLVSLELNLNDPDPIGQVNQWLQHFPLMQTKRQVIVPAFQMLGVEQLTRQSATLQSTFLAYLQTIEPQLSTMESSLVLWMTQPWFRLLPEAAPEFWRCRTGIFEFIGDPTPLPTTSPERISLQSSAIESLEVEPLLSVKPAENPWLRLADELTLWEDSPDSESLNQLALDQPADSASLQLESWLKSLNQQLELSQLDSPPSPTATATQPPTLIAVEADSSLLAPLTAVQHPVEAAIESLSADLEASLATTPDLEQAIPLLQHIERLQQQISLFQQGQGSPIFLATAYQTLGNFYRDCIEQGDASAENVAMAIQTYEQALQWFPDSASEQPEILNDLGNLYWMTAQLQQDPAAIATCLLQTVHRYQQALSHLNSAEPDALYALVQNNLGAAYADLARYQDPIDNFQQSVWAYQQALQHYSEAIDPVRYASTQNNLGTTYWNLAQYEQPDWHLKQAIVAYSEALSYYSPEQEPLTYAMIQNNLGTAYWNLAQYGSAADYLTAAVSAYHIALEYRTFDAAPASFAATQNNLGTAYWHLAHHTDQTPARLTYLKQAIAAYDLTLAAANYLHQQAESPVALNFDLASTQNNLGLAHYQLAIAADLAEATDADRASHLDAALHYHLLALQQWEPHAALQQTALNGVIQTVRAFYSQMGLSGQNQALSQIPSQFLPDILPQL